MSSNSDICCILITQLHINARLCIRSCVQITELLRESIINETNFVRKIKFMLSALYTTLALTWYHTIILSLCLGYGGGGGGVFSRLV